MRIPTTVMAAMTALSLTAAPAAAASKPNPKIALTTARAKALELAPGKVISAEYEREGGVWRYSFDIQQKDHVQEIGIDAMTGKVVENKSEGVHDSD